MKPSIAKIAASTLAVGASIAGFTPLLNGALSNGASASDSRAVSQAGEAASDAREALADNDNVAAIRHAERAVQILPNSAEYRHLLGRSYLAAGRFSSAETSFQDALTINPDLGRTAFNLALSQIAQGERSNALAQLSNLEGRLGASDLGLAMALAGNHDRAISILQQASRANGGDPRARQNLALSYALAGRWAEARITAAQDVSVADLEGRMQDWSQFASAEHDYEQVSTLLGVTADPVDPGQPMRLALAPRSETFMTAQADGTEVIEADEAPMRVAVAETEKFTQPEPYAFIVEEEDSYAPVDADQAIAAAAGPIEEPIVALTAPVVAAGSQAEQEWLGAVRASRDSDSPAEAAAPVAQPEASVAHAQGSDGRYVVQLGAFAMQANVQVAWGRALRRHSALSNYSPTGATIEHGRTLYRLSFGGFETRDEADRMCRTLRSHGQECFVRARAGDAPLQMAARMGAGAAALR